MQEGTALEAVLRRDRVIVLGGLVMISALARPYLGDMAWGMEAMDMAMQMAMPRMRVWSAVDIFLLFVMWVVMMVPTAASMVLTCAALNRRQQTQEEPFASTAVFLGGYLVVWTGFSALATLAQ
jgi:predicted metal-binding membrane protein